MTGFEPLVLEATARPTEPQPLPIRLFLLCLYLSFNAFFNPSQYLFSSLLCFTLSFHIFLFFFLDFLLFVLSTSLSLSLPLLSISSSFSLSLSMPPYVFSILWRFTKTLSWSTFAILLNKLKLHSAPTSDVACAAFLWLAWLQHFSHAFATLYYPMRSCQYFRSFVAASIFVLVLLLL